MEKIWKNPRKTLHAKYAVSRLTLLKVFRLGLKCEHLEQQAGRDEDEILNNIEEIWCSYGPVETYTKERRHVDNWMGAENADKNLSQDVICTDVRIGQGAQCSTKPNFSQMGLSPEILCWLFDFPAIQQTVSPSTAATCRPTLPLSFNLHQVCRRRPRCVFFQSTE